MYVKAVCLKTLLKSEKNKKYTNIKQKLKQINFGSTALHFRNLTPYLKQITW